MAFPPPRRSTYGKALKDITIAEAAMLAGLPKAPSAYNPVANPKRAQLRQRYVLRRMHELNFIDEAQMKAAQTQVLHVKRDVNDFGVRAEYIAEMARQIAVERFPEDAYSRGLRVITTVSRADQQAAYQSLRRGVMDYDRRHGYRGAEAYIDMKDVSSDQDESLEEHLAEFDDSDDLLPAVVLEATPKLVRAYLRGGEVLKIGEDGLKFAARMIDDKAPPNKRLRRGAVIRVQKFEKGWQILQLPDVEAAFVAASPVDGSIRALVGGFDFNRNKFNHVTQAWRQPGSSFKPFIYSAALEKGYSPASVIADEPISISAEETGSQAWEPKNYDGKYEGPMSLRTALAKSKNMVSIRLLRSIGTHYAQDYVTRFGFEAEKHPPYLTMALGAGAVTPWQQLSAYSIFANGGYRIAPYVVRQILDNSGTVVAEIQPAVAGDENLRAIDARNAWLMDSMMHDVVRRGTATRAAAALKRSDLAGKTGTTNDYIDAWFCGYQPTIVGVAWIGFDQPRAHGQWRNRRRGGAADLDRLHGARPEKRARELPRGTGRPDADYRQRSGGQIQPGTDLQGAAAAGAAGARTKARNRNRRRCRTPNQKRWKSPCRQSGKGSCREAHRRQTAGAQARGKEELKADPDAGLFRYGARQRCQQFLAIAGADPAPALGAKMDSRPTSPPARFRAPRRGD
jgi:penicillin-binding protein 1A